MSWQAYVDDQLLATGKVAQAAILGQQGGVWATSPDFALSPEEQKAVVNAFGNLDGVLANGLRISGNKYFTLSANPRTIQCKKQADGVIAVKTKQAILVAVYKAPVQAPEAVPVVEKLADYLISVNY